MPFGCRPAIASEYAKWWSDMGINHELTISLGISPTRFSPEERLMPILKNLVREGAKKLRGLSKRQAPRLQYNDPEALMLAGFYEATKRSGEPFPHWHGGVALRPGEEPLLRQLLWDCIGEDADDPLKPFEPSRTSRPLITGPGMKPTFHLAQLRTPERYVRYSTKKTHTDDIIHWTTADLLA
jgi:hypothetical protein